MISGEFMLVTMIKIAAIIVTTILTLSPSKAPQLLLVDVTQDFV